MLWGGGKRTSNGKNNDKNKSKNKSGWENVCIPTLATIKPSRRWGTQTCWDGLDKDKTTAATAKATATTTTKAVCSLYLLWDRTDMGEGLRFLWNATRGDRLRPWRSPYLRWRLETYSGQRADTVTARDFWRLFWTEKRQLFRFLRWTREIKGYAETGKEH